MFLSTIHVNRLRGPHSRIEFDDTDTRESCVESVITIRLEPRLEAFRLGYRLLYYSTTPCQYCRTHDSPFTQSPFTPQSFGQSPPAMSCGSSGSPGVVLLPVQTPGSLLASSIHTPASVYTWASAQLLLPVLCGINIKYTLLVTVN